MFCVSCINCSYNNIAKGIHLHDKTKFLMQKKVIQERAFESKVSLFEVTRIRVNPWKISVKS